MRSRTRCWAAGRLTQTPSTMTNGGAEPPPTPAFWPQTAPRAAYRLDYAHDSVGHDSVRNCSAGLVLRPELLNQSGTAAVTSLAARGLTDTRTRAAASLAGWPLPTVARPATTSCP